MVKMLAIAHFLSAAVMMRLTKLRLDKTILFSPKELLVCLILGGLPDIDGPLQAISYLFGNNLPLHRAFTHNLFIPIALLLIGLAVWICNYKFAAKIIFLASLCYGVHIILDLIAGSMVILFPINSCWVGMHACYRSVPCMTIFAALDAVLLIIWLAWRYYKTYF